MWQISDALWTQPNAEDDARQGGVGLDYFRLGVSAAARHELHWQVDRL